MEKFSSEKMSTEKISPQIISILAEKSDCNLSEIFPNGIFEFPFHPDYTSGP